MILLRFEVAPGIVVTRRFFAVNVPESGTFKISGAELHHLKDVLRLRSGDEVVVFDGSGREFFGRLLRIDPNAAVVEITRCETFMRQPCIPIHVCSAIPKGRRAEFLIEKLCEIGISAFTPVLWKRSVVRVAPNSEKFRKWQRIAIEAAKQSGRTTIARIESPMTFSQLAELVKSTSGQAWSDSSPSASRAGECSDSLAIALLASVRAQETILELLRKIVTCSKVICVVGPEGGLTAEEEMGLVKVGAIPVRLTQTTLRVETAAIAMTAIVSVWLAASGLLESSTAKAARDEGIAYQNLT